MNYAGFNSLHWEKGSSSTYKQYDCVQGSIPATGRRVAALKNTVLMMQGSIPATGRREKGTSSTSPAPHHIPTSSATSLPFNQVIYRIEINRVLYTVE
jgi:hypothetical protein